MNFKNIILVIAIIVVVFGAVSFLMAHQAHPKIDSKVIMTSADNITEGDNITVKLTDVNNTPLSNQKLNITIVGSSRGSLQKVLTTDSQGQASLKVDNSTIGNCVIKVKYGGNDKYNGCNFTDTLIINQKVVVKIPTNSTGILGNNSTVTATSNSSYNQNSYYYERNYNSYDYGENIITVEDY